MITKESCPAHPGLVPLVLQQQCAHVLGVVVVAASEERVVSSSHENHDAPVTVEGHAHLL